jgi:Holliday junction resolvase RusA-like endonuclease
MNIQSPKAVAGPRLTGDGILADLPSPVAFSLPTPPSVNELYRNLPGRGRVKTGVYDDFVRRGVASIRSQSVMPVPGRVVVIFGVERMSASADIDNRLKSMLDTIVKAGVIGDDNLVTAIAVSWLPKANGLAHCRIFPVQKLDLSFHPSQSGASGGWYITAPLTNGEEDGNFPL